MSSSKRKSDDYDDRSLKKYKSDDRGGSSSSRNDKDRWSSSSSSSSSASKSDRYGGSGGGGGDRRRSSRSRSRSRERRYGNGSSNGGSSSRYGGSSSSNSNRDSSSRQGSNSSSSSAAPRKLTNAEELALKKQKEDEEYRQKVENQLKELEAASAGTPLTEEEEVELARKRRMERLAKIAHAKPAAVIAPTATATATATAAVKPPAPAAAAAAATAAASASPRLSAMNGKHTPSKLPPASPKLSAAGAASVSSPSAAKSAATQQEKTGDAKSSQPVATTPLHLRSPALGAARPAGAATAAAAASDGFDIFGSDEPLLLGPAASTSTAAAVAAAAHANVQLAAASQALGGEAATLMDNWDDHEGYYKFRPGDILDNRYHVFACQGRGVFSTVLRVRDAQVNQRELVIKVIRVDSSNTFRKAGQKELEFCQLISDRDPENKRHVIRMLSYFEHRSHLCLVFEPLSMNLREVLKKYGGVGLTIVGVKSYAKQLFVALKHLKKCGVIHADLKPDNILVNDTMNIVKVCDFGSAGKISEVEITPYLVSRFYRAPEIMLALPYNEALDVWSVGCILYELYTGKILFPGNNNNEMLRMHQELKGPFPNKMIKTHKKNPQFANKHFDDDLVFEQTKKDPVSGIDLRQKIKFLHATKELHSLMLNSAKVTDSDRRKVTQLADLCAKCFVLDPSKRITVEMALQHPFIKDP